MIRALLLFFGCVIALMAHGVRADEATCFRTIDCYHIAVGDPAKPAVLYTLITVTNGGSVGHSSGYNSLALCEEAKSVATTGHTMEQNKAAQDAEDAARKKAADEWRTAHPPHPPRNAKEREMVENAKKAASGDLSFTTFGHPVSDGVYSTANADDGLIYEWPSLTGYTGTILRFPPPSGDIKFAECVIEPEQH